MTERNPMPVCTPEAAGVPSGAIERYIQRLTDARLLMHDVLIARNGALICEAYWKPIDESFRHREYSCSKSFVSVAVGLLIGQAAYGGSLRGLLRGRRARGRSSMAEGNDHPRLSAHGHLLRSGLVL